MRSSRLALAIAALVVSTTGLHGCPHAASAIHAQERPSLIGTWVILLEGHQIGLDVEQQDAAGVLEATLYIMGQRVVLDGSVKDGTFLLTSDAQVGDTQSHGQMVKMKLAGTHKDDDTLEGTIDLPRGPMTWTAERLKKP